MPPNTLNLDTRRNVFPAGASVHRMFDAGRWVLAPEEDIVQKYYDTLTSDPLAGVQADRASFPVIHDCNNFKYNLIPIRAMEDIAFSRQDFSPETENDARPVSEEKFVNHVYPFDTLSVLVSHIHPKFAIVSAGLQLWKLSTNERNDLIRSFPRLFQILAVSRAWTPRTLPERQR